MLSKCEKPRDVSNDYEVTQYEAPQLTVVGEAAAVILGVPGCGVDGLDGMSECHFEFESDEEPA